MPAAEAEDELHGFIAAGVVVRRVVSLAALPTTLLELAGCADPEAFPTASYIMPTARCLSFDSSVS